MKRKEILTKLKLCIAGISVCASTSLFSVPITVLADAADESTSETAQMASELILEDEIRDNSIIEYKGEFGADNTVMDGDNAEIIDAIDTKQTDETPVMINVTAIMPEHFGLSAYVEITGTETGLTYRLPLYAVNQYSERVFVPEGIYYISNAAIYEDNTNIYPFDYDTSDFVALKDTGKLLEIKLSNFEKVEKDIREKREEIVPEAEKVQEVVSTYPVTFSGTGQGKLGITGEPWYKFDIIVKITKSGPLGDGRFDYSTDGGETWKKNIEIPLSGFYEPDSTGLTFEFVTDFSEPSGFTENDEYTCFIEDPDIKLLIENNGSRRINVSAISITEGLSTVEVMEDYGKAIKIKIEKSGSFNEAVWKYSIDGGDTWSEQSYAKEELIIEEAGIKLVFTINSKDEDIPFVRGDEYSISAKREGKSLNINGVMIAFIGVFGTAGVFLYAAWKYLKSLIPTNDDFSIKR